MWMAGIRKGGVKSGYDSVAGDRPQAPRNTRRANSNFRSADADLRCGDPSVAQHLPSSIPFPVLVKS